MQDLFIPGVRDVLVAAGPGGAPLVQIFRSQTLVNRFFAVEDSFRGGINVAAFDDASGTPWIVVGANTSSSRVTVRNGKDLSFRPGGSGSFFVLPGLVPGVNVAAV